MACVREEETPEETTQRRQSDRLQKTNNRKLKRERVETVDEAIQNFKFKWKKQPVYICISCHRLLWQKGVHKFNLDKYANVDTALKHFVLAEKFRIKSIDGSTYICITCHNALKKNRATAQCKVSGMELWGIPDEVKDLNSLELHLISKQILFMKLLSLLSGKQRGIKGAAVNVPADLGPACSLLP